ncbi:MAG: hypothetical protein KDB02_10885 [Acidimicrobiales bacterium]|nr:hypothetical protein [Acidimicrobiales bacterium]
MRRTWKRDRIGGPRGFALLAAAATAMLTTACIEFEAPSTQSIDLPTGSATDTQLLLAGDFDGDGLNDAAQVTPDGIGLTTFRNVSTPVA